PAVPPPTAAGWWRRPFSAWRPEGSTCSGPCVPPRQALAPAEIDQDVAVGIDARGLERMDDDRRVRNLDDRRAGHDVAGNQTLAPDDRRGVEVAQLRPVDRSLACLGLAPRRTVGLAGGDDARLGAGR